VLEGEMCSCSIHRSTVKAGDIVIQRAQPRLGNRSTARGHWLASHERRVTEALPQADKRREIG